MKLILYSSTEDRRERKREEKRKEKKLNKIMGILLSNHVRITTSQV